MSVSPHWICSSLLYGTGFEISWSSSRTATWSERRRPGGRFSKPIVHRRGSFSCFSWERRKLVHGNLLTSSALLRISFPWTKKDDGTGRPPIATYGRTSEAKPDEWGWIPRSAGTERT